MGKDKTSTSSSQFALSEEYKAIMEDQYRRGLGLASLGYEPNRAPTIAGFTDQQKAGMWAGTNAARAFNMVGAEPEIPLGQGRESFMGMDAYTTIPAFDAAYFRAGDARKKARANYFNDLRSESGMWGDRERPESEYENLKKTKALTGADFPPGVVPSEMDFNTYAETYFEGDPAKAWVSWLTDNSPTGEPIKIDLGSFFGK